MAMKREIEVEKEHSRASTQSIIPFEQRPTCTIAQACNAAGLGKTKFYELLARGMIETVWVGRRRLVRVRSLLHYLDSAPTDKQGDTRHE
jgi:excisionase family DNA binding protein